MWYSLIYSMSLKDVHLWSFYHSAMDHIVVNGWALELLVTCKSIQQWKHSNCNCCNTLLISHNQTASWLERITWGMTLNGEWSLQSQGKLKEEIETKAETVQRNIQYPVPVLLRSTNQKKLKWKKNFWLFVRQSKGNPHVYALSLVTNTFWFIYLQFNLFPSTFS